MPATDRICSRWQAAGIHLLVSIALSAAVAALIFRVWYPQPFAAAAGAGALAKIFIGLNLAAPLLTLVVYRHGKQGMAFDLVFISVVQLAAFGYGLFAIAQARPVFIVVTRDMTFLTSANAVSDADLTLAANPAFRRRSWRGPVLVAATPPASAEARQALLESGLVGRDINVLPKHFRDYDTVAAEVLRSAPSLAALAVVQPALVGAFSARVGISIDDLRFLPLRGRRPERDWAIVFDRQQRIAGVIETDPWPAIADSGNP